MNPTPSRVVVFAPNWLGDAVMALPAIAAVRRAGVAALTVAARPPIAPLFGLVPGVDDVIVLDAKRRSWAAGCDAAVLLPNSFAAALTAWRAGVPERWGYRTDWRGPLYEIDAEAPGLGWHLRVEAWLAVGFEGDLRVDDPDGIVVDAQFVCVDDCGAHLAGAHPWVAEPLSEWLTQRWEGTRRYGYRVDGTELRSLVVTRT